MGSYFHPSWMSVGWNGQRQATHPTRFHVERQRIEHEATSHVHARRALDRNPSIASCTSSQNAWTRSKLASEELRLSLPERSWTSASRRARRREKLRALLLSSGTRESFAAHRSSFATRLRNVHRSVGNGKDEESAKMRCAQAYFASLPTRGFEACSTCLARADPRSERATKCARWLVLADAEGRATVLREDGEDGAWRVSDCLVLSRRKDRMQEVGIRSEAARQAWDALRLQLGVGSMRSFSCMTRQEGASRMDTDRNPDEEHEINEVEDKIHRSMCMELDSNSQKHKLVVQSTRWTLYYMNGSMHETKTTAEDGKGSIHQTILTFESMRSATGGYWEGGCFIDESVQDEMYTVRLAVWRNSGRMRVVQVQHRWDSSPNADDVCVSKASVSPPVAQTGHPIGACFVAPVDEHTIAQVLNTSEAPYGERRDWIQFWKVKSVSGEHLELVEEQTLELSQDTGCAERAPEHSTTCLLAAGGDSYCPSVLAIGYKDGSVVLQQLLGGTSSRHKLHKAPVTSLGEVFLHVDKGSSSEATSEALLVSGASDGSMALLDMEAEKVLHHWNPFACEVVAISAPPMPSREKQLSWIHSCFAASDSSGSVCIYNVNERYCMHILGGHPFPPVDFAWDVTRAYLVCLCQDLSARHGPISHPVAYAWDILSGRLERVFKGSIALEMFSLAKQRGYNNSVANNVMPQVVHLATTAGSQCGGEEHSLHGHWRPIQPVLVMPGTLVLDINMRSLLNKDLSSSCVSAGLSFRTQCKKDDAEELKAYQQYRAVYALRLAIAVLHQWGLDECLDSLLKEELAIHPLTTLLPLGSSTATVSADGTICLSLDGNRKWTPSSARVLAILAITNHLISESAVSQNACAALATFYGVQIWEKFRNKMEADLVLFATHWQDFCQPVRDAAHVLMRSSISQLPLDSLQLMLGVSDSEFVQEQRSMPECSELRVLTAGAACAAAPEYLEKVAPNLPSFIVPKLVMMVMQAPDPYSAAAASVLADGMKCNWREVLGMELAAFMKEILVLYDRISSNIGSPRSKGQGKTLDRNFFGIGTIPSLGAIASLGQAIGYGKISRTAGVEGPFVTTEQMQCHAALSRLLPATAATDPLLFFTIVVQRMVLLPPSSPAHVHGLLAALQLVQEYPAVSMMALPQLTSLLLLAISPAVPERRTVCLQASTALVEQMSNCLPSVAFHPGTMLLGVATPIESVSVAPLVEIYDLHSAVKRCMLFDQEQQDSRNNRSLSAIALSFDKNGARLAALPLPLMHVLIWDLRVPWHSRIINKPAEIRPQECIKIKDPSTKSKLAGITPTMNHKIRLTWSEDNLCIYHCNALLSSVAL